MVNQVLRAIGIDDPPRWLQSPTWAVPAVVLMGLWGVGGGAIIYLAGLQNIPPALYQAAKIDGAGPWQTFRHITLPLLTPTLLFTLLIGLIEAFQVFDTAFVLGGGSRGGTRGSLLFYVLNLWNEGFRNGRFGYASALAWVLVVVAAVVIVLIFRDVEPMGLLRVGGGLEVGTAVEAQETTARDGVCAEPEGAGQTRGIPGADLRGAAAAVRGDPPAAGLDDHGRPQARSRAGLHVSTRVVPDRALALGELRPRAA